MLTQTPIVEAIHTGKIDQSPLAIELIDEAKALTGVDIVGCYAQFDTYLSEIPKQKKTNKSNLFVNHSYLEVYIRDSSNTQNSELLNKQITALFSQFISNHKDKIDRPRLLTPEELRYYGWLNTPKAQRNYSKFIKPQEGDLYSDKIEVEIESFDGLATWHYFSDSLRAINNLLCIKELYAKVYCGWDDNKKQMNLYVILPKEINDDTRASLTESMFSVVKERDMWGIITQSSFDPIYNSSGCLPKEIMFSLLRN